MGAEARESPPETFALFVLGGVTTPEMDFFRCSGGRTPPGPVQSKLLGGIKKGGKMHFLMDSCHFDKFTCQNVSVEPIFSPPEIDGKLNFGVACPPK